MDQVEVRVIPGAWSEAAHRYIQSALVHASANEVRAQVDSGSAALFYAFVGEKMIGAYVLRIDSSTHGPEGVVVAAGGDNCGIDLIATVMPVIEKQFMNVTEIRVHTSRRGMVKSLVEKHGYEEREIVLSKRVKNEQV